MTLPWYERLWRRSVRFGEWTTLVPFLIMCGLYIVHPWGRA